MVGILFYLSKNGGNKILLVFIITSIVQTAYFLMMNVLSVAEQRIMIYKYEQAT